MIFVCRDVARNVSTDTGKRSESKNPRQTSSDGDSYFIL